MFARQRVARYLGIGATGFWLLSAAAIAGTVLLSGCGKIEDLTNSSDDDKDPASLNIAPAATSVAPGNALAVTATVNDKDGSPVEDGTLVSFAVDVLGSISPAVSATTAGQATTTFTAGAQTGTATIAATAGDARHAVSIQVAAGAPPPPPPPGNARDMLDPSLISWDEPAGNVGAWNITSKITSASMTHERYSITRNPMNNWPPVQQPGWSKPSVGNWWVIAKCGDGKWHGATIEWLGVGVTSTAARKWDGHDDIHGCLTNWRPKAGETAYAMQSTHARSGVINNNRQRTNLYRITMP